MTASSQPAVLAATNTTVNVPAVATPSTPSLNRTVVLVLDFGSQYTQLIARRVRELGVYSVSLPAGVPLDQIQALHPTIVILSGGPESVHEEGSPTVPSGFFEWTKGNKVTVLGICYGMHIIVQLLGGKVKSAKAQEYGRMKIQVVPGGGTLYGDEVDAEQVVWMSHGDEAVELPRGFEIVARSEQGAIVAVENVADKIYGLQYHPEVHARSIRTPFRNHPESCFSISAQSAFRICRYPEWMEHFCHPSYLRRHSYQTSPATFLTFNDFRHRYQEPFSLPPSHPSPSQLIHLRVSLSWQVTHSVLGLQTLRHFLFSVGGAAADWKMDDVLNEAIELVKASVGDSDHAICALSGGVDSTVAATLVHQAIGDRLHCVFVDNGLLRWGGDCEVLVSHALGPKHASWVTIQNPDLEGS